MWRRRVGRSFARSIGGTSSATTTTTAALHPAEVPAPYPAAPGRQGRGLLLLETREHGSRGVSVASGERPASPTTTVYFVLTKGSSRPRLRASTTPIRHISFVAGAHRMNFSVPPPILRQHTYIGYIHLGERWTSKEGRRLRMWHLFTSFRSPEPSSMSCLHRNLVVPRRKPLSQVPRSPKQQVISWSRHWRGL